MAAPDRKILPVSLYKNTHLRIPILKIPSRGCIFSNKEGTSKGHLRCLSWARTAGYRTAQPSDSPRSSRRYNGTDGGTPGLYPLHLTVDDKALLRLTIRRRFVGLTARPRAATSSSMRSMHQQSRLAAGDIQPLGGRVSPAGGTGSAGQARNGRYARLGGGYPRRGSRTCHDSPRFAAGYRTRPIPALRHATADKAAALRTRIKR